MTREKAMELLQGGAPGVSEWNAWRETEQPPPDLQGAYLAGCELVGANLSQVNLAFAALYRANLEKADLRRTPLYHTNFRQAVLRGANFDGAQMHGAVLTQSDLGGATLRDANLNEAILTSAQLQGADLSGADLRGAILVDLDISALGSLPVSFERAHIDWRTVARSMTSSDLPRLLQAANVPDVVAMYLVESVRSIDPAKLFSMLQSTFISFGGPDEAFAQKLRDRLRAAGAEVWFFKTDARWGQQISAEVVKGTEKYDRILLICSETSLSRPGVLFEIKRALAREAKEYRTDILFPITLDDFVFERWRPSDTEYPTLRDVVKERVIGDFRGADKDEAKFNAAFLKLVDALKLPLMST